MPLGDCTAIFFSSPAFTMVLSFIILKWVGLNFETFLDTQWSSGITVGWYVSLLHLLCWLGYQTLFLNLGFWNLRLRCWSYLGLPLSSPVFPCPLGMFLSITWNGTLQKMTGVTLVRCNAKMCLILSIHLKMIHVVHADHMQPAESGSYNLEGVLCALAVPFLSAWIVIITRQVLMSFRYSASNFSFPCFIFETFRQSMCIILSWCFGE